MQNSMQSSTDKLMKDLRAVVADAEDLLEATAGQSGERIQKARARAEASLRNARSRIEGAASDVDAQLRANPWTALGIAAGAGLIAGILLSRK